MGLKALLTNLEQGVQSYPNSNTPSTSGGFNYGAGSIFNTKSFNQRTLEFGKGTAYDRPGQDFSSEPLIGRNIEIPAPNDQPSSFLGLIERCISGIIKGSKPSCSIMCMELPSDSSWFPPTSKVSYSSDKYLVSNPAL